jgi:hypothetical protein
MIDISVPYHGSVCSSRLGLDSHGRLIAIVSGIGAIDAPPGHTYRVMGNDVAAITSKVTWLGRPSGFSNPVREPRRKNSDPVPHDPIPAAA